MKVNYSNIIKTVSNLVKKHQTRDPFELCNALNISVRYKDLGGVKAFFFYQSRIKNIVINQNVDEILQRILCAHELGHAVLHTDRAKMRGFQEIEIFDSLVPTEYEANLFAAELLIDDEEIMDLITSEKGFYEIAQILNVPSELLTFKFKQMNLKGCQLAPVLLTKSNIFNSASSTVY